MATVYERIIFCEKNHWFRFKPIAKRHIGQNVLREWNKVGFGKDDELSFIESIEPDGTFKVLNYPDYFTLTIDNEIADYVKRIITGQYKKNTEKPKPMKQELPPKTTTSEPQRKRTRKPVPAYTTRKK